MHAKKYTILFFDQLYIGGSLLLANQYMGVSVTQGSPISSKSCYARSSGWAGDLSQLVCTEVIELLWMMLYQSDGMMQFTR
jgi:hypothetical protein